MDSERPRRRRAKPSGESHSAAPPVRAGLPGGQYRPLSDAQIQRIIDAAYEVLDDTPAAFALAVANPAHGRGWLPQVVVPSYVDSLRFLGDFALGP